MKIASVTLLLIALAAVIVIREYQFSNQLEAINVEIQQLRQSVATSNARLDKLRALQEQLFQAGATSTTIAASPINPNLLNATIKSIVKNELKQLTASDKTTSEEAFEPNMDPEVAFASSQQVIVDAIATGVWTLEANAELLKYTDSLTREQKIELLGQYHVAVNRGELDISGVVGSPF